MQREQPEGRHHKRFEIVGADHQDDRNADHYGHNQKGLNHWKGASEGVHLRKQLEPSESQADSRRHIVENAPAFIAAAVSVFLKNLAWTHRSRLLFRTHQSPDGGIGNILAVSAGQPALQTRHQRWIDVADQSVAQTFGSCFPPLLASRVSAAAGHLTQTGVPCGVVREIRSRFEAARRPPPGLIHHSDRGSQYASYAFQAQLKEYGMVCSMSRKGNCWDNAPAESFFNSLKSERVHGAHYNTRDEAKADLFDYIEPFYNHRRSHSTLGYASPKGFMEAWINNQTEQEKAA